MRAEACRAALGAVLCTTLLANPGTSKAYVYLEEDIQETTVELRQAASRLADASYPVLKSLKPETFSPFEQSLASIIVAAEPSELAKTFDLYDAVVRSVPKDQAGVSLGEGLSLGSCAQVPLPSALISAVGEPAREALKSLPKDDARICVPPPENLEKLAAAAAAADAAKVNELTAQLQLTWNSAIKQAGFKQATAWPALWRDVLQGVRPQQRDALKNARNAYAATSKTLETLKVKQIEGPPKCYTMGCKTRFESGIFVDDELKQKKMVKQRYPDNYFII